jgi:hypothetical protein
MPTHRDSPHSHAALVERVVLLRTALKGLTNDHTRLHRRQLSRVRAENAALRAQTTTGPAAAALEAAAQ